MLARLEAIDGVALAEVDHRGELLRLRLTSDTALADAVATLREVGYRADPLREAPVVERWYGRAAVHELSREEGAVIAGGVVPAFARARGLAPQAAASLEDVVARALYACFAERTLAAPANPGALRRECLIAVEMAVRDVLGPEGARDLAAILSADLERAGSNEPRNDGQAS